jgi:hypothetical protein
MSIKYTDVGEATKKKIAGRQFYKCANNLTAKLDKLENFKCPLWAKADENKGSFDESGYDIDHINEHAVTLDDGKNNLQALCKSCHSVKTKNISQEKK